MPQAVLAPGVHMVAVRDDVVVLNVGQDRYLCLPGAAALIGFPKAGVITAQAEVVDQLQAAGLVALAPPDPDRRAPMTPNAELNLTEEGGALSLLDTAFRSLVATAGFRRRALHQLLRPGPRRARPVTAADRRRIAARVATYRRALPLLPFEGLCLQRAYQLRQVLASDGFAVDWVFGVRTWPFFAHCWLQLDDLVIGDRIERVRAFTPIAVF